PGRPSRWATRTAVMPSPPAAAIVLLGHYPAHDERPSSAWRIRRHSVATRKRLQNCRIAGLQEGEGKGKRKGKGKGRNAAEGEPRLQKGPFVTLPSCNPAILQFCNLAGPRHDFLRGKAASRCAARSAMAGSVTSAASSESCARASSIDPSRIS